WQLGRVSFNPLKHIDPFGTVILPGMLLLAHSPFLFGYAKPVPVNFRNLNHPRIDMVWVALAGPAIKLVLALGGGAASPLPLPPLRPGQCRAMDAGQPQKCVPDQYRAGDLQHDADPAAGRRPGRRRAADAGAGLPAVADGTLPES